MQTRIHSVAPVEQTKPYQQRHHQQENRQQQGSQAEANTVVATPIVVASNSMNASAKALGTYDAVASLNQNNDAAKVAFNFSV